MIHYLFTCQNIDHAQIYKMVHFHVISLTTEMSLLPIVDGILPFQYP